MNQGEGKLLLLYAPNRVYQPHIAWRANVIGVPGEGKSYLRYQLLRPIYRCVLWNPFDDYNVGEVITVDEFEKRMESYRKDLLRVTVTPSRFDDVSMRDEYERLCYLVYEVGALHFASEEIGLVADPRDVPGGLNQLCIKGRHRAVSLSFYGQRFHQFPLIVRGTASEIFAFRQTDPDDVKDFDRRIAPSEPPVSLNELPPHHFIHWTPEGGAVLCQPLPYKSSPESTGDDATKEVA